MTALAGRHVVSISDLANDEIEGVFRLTDRFAKGLQDGPLSLSRKEPRKRTKSPLPRRSPLSGVCVDRILATVFLEPSTRTRLSFESAMQRLGGRVISVPDPGSSSTAKGESLADTIRVIASYADIIVLRHPHDGSALLAAESLDSQRLSELGRRVPIVNGGDGAHEHPTQTLCDLYTLRREHQRIAGLRVALCGDLLHARTVHSLAYGLARFGAQLRCISPPELRLPTYVKRRLELEYQCTPAEYDSFTDLAEPEPAASARDRRGRGRSTRPLDLDRAREGIGRLLDAVYVTRIQKERFAEPSLAEAMRGSYLVDPLLLTRIGKHTTIMHPLPRVDEVDAAVDADTRAAYFRQAAYGVPVRMALIALLLGKRKLGGRQSGQAAEPPTGEGLAAPGVSGVRCQNPACITNHELGARPRLVPVPHHCSILRCAYCEHEQATHD